MRIILVEGKNEIQLGQTGVTDGCQNIPVKGGKVKKDGAEYEVLTYPTYDYDNRTVTVRGRKEVTTEWEEGLKDFNEEMK